MQRAKYFVAMLTVALCCACSGGSRSVQMHDTERVVWDSAEEFTYDNSDTLYRRDISITVRYNGRMTAESVPMKILTVSPDSMVLEEDFTLRIPQLADMRPDEHTFIYRKGVLLKHRGEYMFRLTPLEPIEGIASVGIIVDEK